MTTADLLRRALRQWVAIVAAWAFVVTAFGTAPASADPWLSDEHCLNGVVVDGAVPAPGSNPGKAHPGQHPCCFPGLQIVAGSPPPTSGDALPVRIASFTRIAPLAVDFGIVAKPERHPLAARAPPFA